MSGQGGTIYKKSSMLEKEAYEVLSELDEIIEFCAGVNERCVEADGPTLFQNCASS